MPRFLVCCRREEVQPTGWTLCSSNDYGEYDNLEAAIARMNEIVNNHLKWKNTGIAKSNATKLASQAVESYYVNELAPKGIYPIVVKTYPYNAVA